MTRFVRHLVSALTIVGGVAAVPAVADAQVVNVAPPAYGPVAPVYPAPQPAPYAPTYYGSPQYGAYVGHRSDEHEWREHERREHERREHMRRCAEAYREGAPRWVLRSMACPA